MRLSCQKFFASMLLGPKRAGTVTQLPLALGKVETKGRQGRTRGENSSVVPVTKFNILASEVTICLLNLKRQI